MRSTFLILVCALGACLASSLVGCGHVSPYEREHLSRPCMDRSERDAAKGRFVAHVYDAREGAMGTTENAGGGCGCN
jgi:hypothetical protein